MTPANRQVRSGGGGAELGEWERERGNAWRGGEEWGGEQKSIQLQELVTMHIYSNM